MNRRFTSLVAGLAVAFSSSLFAEDVSMQIAPSFLNFESKVHKLTIHAVIDEDFVDEPSLNLLLHGVGTLPIISVDSDYEDHLVVEAAWDVEALTDQQRETIVAAGEAVFQLSGYRLDSGDPFEGEDEVKVIGGSPRVQDEE